MFSWMQKILLVSALVSSVSADVWAQDAAPRKVKASITKKKFRQFTLGYQLWQETIDASSAGVNSEMLTYFHGFKAGYSWHRPLRNVRWVTVYGADFGFGFAKGAAMAPLTDEVEDQGWYSATVYPGLMYRGTSKSEIGIQIPLTYRIIQWKLDEPFDLDRKGSFSAGVSLMYVARFSLKSSMQVALTHQQMWDATIWSIGYQFDFR